MVIRMTEFVFEFWPPEVAVAVWLHPWSWLPWSKEILEDGVGRE